MKKFAWHFCAVVLCAAFFAGCHLGSGRPGVATIVTPQQLRAVQARATEQNRTLIMLITDSGNGAADNDALTVFTSWHTVAMAGGTAVMAMLDLSVSRTRATAARFHPVETPLLVCFSPQGLTISRDTAPITESLILNRIQQAVARSPELDEKLAQFEQAADSNKNDAAAQMQLADFLMEGKNATEAIPILASIAHSSAADINLRIRAWEELGQAHLWVGEVEKAHFEAESLMAILGPTSPDARAAGHLVLGNQAAANPKRFPRARLEFETAIAAAPDSTYGRQAAAALANLPERNSAQ